MIRIGQSVAGPGDPDEMNLARLSKDLLLSSEEVIYGHTGEYRRAGDCKEFFSGS